MRSLWCKRGDIFFHGRFINFFSKKFPFRKTKLNFLKEIFSLIPSKPTFSRVLSLVDGQKVAETIMAIMQDKFSLQSDVITIDGKAIRSTSDTNKKHSALQIITAYLTESGVVLSQKKINKKTNEIPVLQEMLPYLNIKGKTITADAMHCQRETCERIISQKGDYVIIEEIRISITQKLYCN